MTLKRRKFNVFIYLDLMQSENIQFFVICFIRMYAFAPWGLQCYWWGKRLGAPSTLSFQFQHLQCQVPRATYFSKIKLILASICTKITFLQFFAILELSPPSTHREQKICLVHIKHFLRLFPAVPPPQFF